MEHDIDVQIAKVLKLIFKSAGFINTEDERNVFVGTGVAITKLFGIEAIKFDALSKFAGYQARTILNDRLCTSAGLLYNPILAPVGMIYSQADVELQDEAYGSDGNLKPEWLLRRLIVNKWMSTLATNPTKTNKAKPDWRVRGFASVDVEQPMTISVKIKTSHVEGGKAFETAHVRVHFSWMSRFRKSPGDTHMRILFPSRV